MKRSFWSLVTVVFAGLIALAIPASAQTAPQTLTLVAGWNSVWLEVESVYPAGDPKAGQAKAPADVFGPTAAIDIVATPKLLAGSAEFFAGDPGTIPTFNKDEWQQWKRIDLTDANNLSMVFGNRPYLIHTTAGATLTITGKVRFFRPAWTPDRYNLLGFGLDGAPTFTEFFSGSGTTHPVDKIFTLNAAGTWVKVTAGQTMASGRAYWIFSSGPSNYMGPVAVDFEDSVIGRLNFGDPGDAVAVGTEMLDLEELVFTNYGAAAATPVVTFKTADPLPNALALFRVTPAPTSFGYVRGNAITALGITVPAATPAAPVTVPCTLGAKRTITDDLLHTTLYRIQTSAKGASFYLPVTAVRSGVEEAAVATGGIAPGPVTGLWVGEVIVDGATSIVVNGAPIQPTASAAPLRIILHADTGGTVRLLSQVTLMQTKTADPKVRGVPVLVLDPAKIPFYEGVKVRNGKRVGLRLEAIAYDMPRSASALAGFDLVAADRRPPALQETYDLAKTMTGAIGGTVSATVTLDPFHRSNPLRHAYHQELTKGPQITRTLTLVFDSSQALPDVLTGSYSESILGLIKDNLKLTGRVELRRVSPVATLQGQ